jgi:hypothetical protein
LIIARRDGAPLLQLGPHVFDLVSPAIGGTVEMLLPLVGRVGADHREGAGLRHQREPSHGGVGGTADDAPDRAEQGSQEQQLRRDPQFRGLAGVRAKPSGRPRASQTAQAFVP